MKEHTDPELEFQWNRDYLIQQPLDKLKRLKEVVDALILWEESTNTAKEDPDKSSIMFNDKDLNEGKDKDETADLSEEDLITLEEDPEEEEVKILWEDNSLNTGDCFFSKN